MKKKICLTFDVDWAPDFVVDHVLEILYEYRFNATFFATHSTKIFNNLKNVEIGIHPYITNFSEAQKDVCYLKQLYPEAISLRAHSLTDSGMLNRILNNCGIKIKSNYLLYAQKDIKILKMPYQFDLYEAPIFFIDGSYLLINRVDNKFTINSLGLHFPGIKIFNFHPIHIFLNTEDYSRYEDAKKYINDRNRIKSFINNNSAGIKDMFLSLLFYLKDKSIKTYNLRDFVPVFNTIK